MDLLSVPETGASWPNKPVTIVDFPGFAWIETSNEDSSQNRTAYMAHLAQHVQLPANYLMGDVQPMRGVFNTVIKGVVESRRIQEQHRGIKKHFKLSDPEQCWSSARTEEAQELAKQGSQPTDDLRTRRGVLSKSQARCIFRVDRSKWQLEIFWFADNQNGSVALHRLELKVKGSRAAAGLANHILENLNDVTLGDTLPTTFVYRLSFDAVMERILTESARKRPRWDDGGGGGNAQAQDGKPHANPPQGGGLHQPPQGDSPCGFESEGNRDAGGGNQTTDMTRALSLLAPHSGVANELDLMDLVDEDEQYEIVWSFAAKHIVLYMRGQTS
jgi:hypothetical protein